MSEDDLLDTLQANRTREPDEVEKILTRNFYVDDLLASAPTEESALHLIQEGIARLKRYDLNLCKVQSNAPLITQNYPSSEPPKIITFSDPDNSPSGSSSTSLPL